MKWHVGLGLLGLMVIAGCGKQGGNSTPDTKPLQAQTSPWLFTSTSPADNRGNHGVYLSNGVIGVSLGPFGPDKNSSAFLAGVYDNDENLLTIPLFDQSTAPYPAISTFEQTLDIEHGTLTTTFTDANGNKGRIIAFASRADRSLMVFRYEGVAEPLASRIKSNPVISGSFPGIRAGITVSQIKDTIGTTVIGRIESPISPLSTKNTALKPFDTLLSEHQAQWENAWKSDIIIDGDPEAQRVIHKALFDLRQSAAPKGSNVAIAPEGLAGNFYKGHIFWDADVWMLPALLPFDPDAAADIVGYRNKVRKPATPWESAQTGKERAPSGFSDGRHVIADAGYGALLVMQSSSSITDKRTALQVLTQAADELVKLGFKSGPPSSFGKVTGPDELNMGVEENAYTNAMAKKVLTAATTFSRAAGKPINERWNVLANELVIPMTSQGNIAKCKNDDGKKTKQADGELALWPGDATSDVSLLGKSFDYHKTRPIKNGPAMTDAIHTLIAARLGRAKEAEENFNDSYKPFLRGPFMLFSEKRSMDRCVFVTGLGGLIQSVVYGYAGLELSGNKPIATQNPALPATWKKLTLKGIHHRGNRYDVSIESSGSRITKTN
jgi:trehalose/maltose hydrolase-like predicted phosphorylase